jgi:hypothetical protein
MTEYTVDELFNKPIDQIKTSEKHQFSTKNIITAKHTKAINYTSLHKHKLGHLFNVEVNISFGMVMMGCFSAL